MQDHFSARHPRRRRFAVTVDGVRHEIIVEELEDIPAGSPEDASPSVPAETSSAAAPADGWVNAPMPGTVTEISVKVGDEVKTGDVLLILTAMKLENEITAPAAGTVQTIAVAEGDNVNNGDRLIQLETGGTDR